MLSQCIRAELLAQVNLRFRLVQTVGFKLDHIEAQMVERGAHRIKLVLGFDNQFVIAMKVRPFLLLFRKRPVVSLSTPFLARLRRSSCRKSFGRETSRNPHTRHQVHKLEIRLVFPKLMPDFEGDGNFHGRIIGRRSQ